jgi:DNA repair protein RecN (Recombination protein N)
MIDELQIRDVGVIGSVHLRLAPGLTVLTGETGAGKTLVVTALQLLLGARADATLIRAGADAAVVEGRIHPVPEALRDELGDEPDLVVSREVIGGADGARSRVRIGDRLATVSALGAALDPLVEVHGQGEHARLTRPDVQRGLLDRYAGPSHAVTLAHYRELHDRWVSVRERLERIRSDARARAREIDRLRHEVAEIGAAELDPETDDELDALIARSEHAEQLIGAAGGAAEALDEGGAGAPLGVAVAGLRRASGHDPALDALLERAEGLAVEAADLRRELRDYADSVELDPGRLERLRERRRLLADLTRRYGADVDAVIVYGREAAARLAELEAEESDVDALAAEVGDLAAQLTGRAEEVSAGRRSAAARLSTAVVEQLAELAMPHARFAVTLDDLDVPGPHGADHVRFLFSANPGEPLRPLGDVASGGERSRLSLAVEVALADVEDAQVLVFDEVDAGIGGATAMAVGRKLAGLARGGRQVLCVTHLPQLAAFADTHFVVDKRVRDGRTVTDVAEVSEDGRASELARMLSGSPGGEEALRHADRILVEARGQVRGTPDGGD